MQLYHTPGRAILRPDLIDRPGHDSDLGVHSPDLVHTVGHLRVATSAPLRERCVERHHLFVCLHADQLQRVLVLLHDVEPCLDVIDVLDVYEHALHEEVAILFTAAMSVRGHGVL